MTLSWRPSATAATYKLYWSTSPTVTKASGTPLLNLTSPFIHQSLTNNTAYYYVVTASNVVGESADSAVATATPLAPTGIQPPRVLVTRPDADEVGVRTDAGITARLNNTIAGGTATTANVTLSNSGGSVAASVTAAGETLTITPSAPLAFETQYTMTLGPGLRDQADGGLSYAWQFTTTSPAPTNLVGLAGSNQVTLTWTAVPGATQYLVYRDPAAGGGPTVSFTTTGLSFNDSTASNGITSAYRVAALTPFGLSAPSSQVLVTPIPSKPYPPGSLRVRPARSSALVTWAPATDAVGYHVFRSPSSGGPWTQVAASYGSTSFLDTNLTPGATVFYVVQTQALGALSAYSAEAAGTLDAAKASAPGGLVTSRGNGWLQLSWDPVSGATAYVIYQLSSPVAPLTQAGYVTSGTSFDAEALTNGTSYRFLVGAVTNGLIGDFADLGGTPGPLFQPARMVLGTPLAGVDRVDLNWTGGAGATSYTVLRSTTLAGTYTPIGSSLADTAVTGGTTYFYAVRANNGTVQGPESNRVSVTPLTNAVPVAPQNLAAEATVSAVQLSWSPVANAQSYEVGVSSVSGGPFTTSGGCVGAEPFETRCSISAPNETAVYMAVRATNGLTAGPWSTEVVATPLGIGPTAGLDPPTLRTLAGNGEVSVYWTAVIGATTYRVFRRTVDTDWVSLGVATAATSWEDATVTNGVNYRYAVQAVNSFGPRVSTWAVSVWLTPSVRMPVKPQNVTVVANKDALTVSWTPIPGATSYSVFAGFNAGWSHTGYATSCTPAYYEPFENHCTIPAVNGQTYFISMYATTPEGYSTFTGELVAQPDGLAPLISGAAVTPGSATLTVDAPLASGATSYRFYRRAHDSGWELVATKPGPLLTQVVNNGLEYAYGVQAVSGTGTTSAWSTTTWRSAAAQLPTTPQAITVTPVAGAVDVSWAPGLGVNGYLVYSAPAPGGPYTLQVNSGDPFETHLTFASPGGLPVTVLLYSFANGSYSGESAEVTATPLTSGLSAPSPSLTPGNQAMQVTWPAVAGATSYRVYRRAPTSAWAQVVTVTSLFWTDEDVENEERFVYAVQAVNAGAVSAWGKTSLLRVDGALPLAPRLVKVTPGNDALQLEWTPVPGATAYRVYTSATQGGPYSGLVTVFGAFESRCVIAATNGTPKWISITTFNAQGQGVASGEVSGTASALLPSATVLRTSQQGAGTIRLDWDAIAGATGYRIFRRLPNALPVLLTQTTALTLDDTGLTTGTNYTYYVQVENGVGVGAWTAPNVLAAP